MDEPWPWARFVRRHRHPSLTTPRLPPRSTSLRIRWHRAFALLATCVLASGFVAFLGTRLVVVTYQESAQRIEEQATIQADLRADMVRDFILLTDPVTAEGQADRQATEADIVENFRQAMAAEPGAVAKAFLFQSRGEWQYVVDSAGPPDHPVDIVRRGAAVATSGPTALELLDRAGSEGREDVRADLGGAGRTYRAVEIVLLLIVVIAIVLAISLSRRLSSDVLTPSASCATAPTTWRRRARPPDRRRPGRRAR